MDQVYGEIDKELEAFSWNRSFGRPIIPDGGRVSIRLLRIITPFAQQLVLVLIRTSGECSVDKEWQPGKGES